VQTGGAQPFVCATPAHAWAMSHCVVAGETSVGALFGWSRAALSSMLKLPKKEAPVAVKKQPMPQPVDEDDQEQAPRAEQPGERRAVRIITRFEAIKEDPDMAIDARNLLAELPELSQRYLALILRNGPVSNAEAAATLKVAAGALEGAVTELDSVIDEIVADAD